MKTRFIQDWGTLDFSTDVFVGYTVDEMLKYAKKYLTDESYEFYKKSEQELRDLMEPPAGGFALEAPHFSIIWLRDWGDGNAVLEILVHELTHITRSVFKTIGAEDEEEFIAYQMTYLFRNILRKLDAQIRPLT